MGYIYFQSRSGILSGDMISVDAKQKTVSVAVIAHNEQARIIRCLESIVRQSVFDRVDQVIVIDNCSTDKTAAVVAEFITNQADSRWSLYQTNQNSLGESRNFALGRVKDSHWIAYVDADSYLPENWLSNHINNFKELGQRDASVAAVGSGNRLPESGPSGRWVNTALQSFLCNGGSAQSFIPSYNVQKNHIPTANGLFLVHALKAIGGVSALMVGEDFELGVRLRKNGYSLYLCPNPVCENDCMDSITDWPKRMFRFGEFGGAFWGKSLHFHWPVIAGLLIPWGLLLSMAVPELLVLYFAGLIFESVRTSLMVGWRSVVPVITVMVATHLSYSAGVYVGLLRWMFGNHELSASYQHEPFEARLIPIVKS